MSIDYKSYDFQVYEYLVRLQQELQESICCLKSQQWLCQIADAQDRIRTRRFRVAVVGEFKRGKSSFINALLGQNVLPVDVSPTTAIVSRIVYGSVPRAFLYYKDGSSREVEIEHLASYVTKLTKESEEQADQIQEAVIEYPSIFCQNYVDLIDTPGMNDDDTMNERTVAALDKIDLAIVAVSAKYPFSETECSFMIKLLENPAISQIVVVVTYIDTVRERDRERVLSYLNERIKETVLERLKKFYDDGDSILQKYETIFGNLRQFGVSCVDAMDAYESGDYDLLEKSGFPRLNKELPQLILSAQNNGAIQRAMSTIERIVCEYKKEYSAMAKKCREIAIQTESFKKNFSAGCRTQIAQSAADLRNALCGHIDRFRQNAENEFIKYFTDHISVSDLLDIAELCETVRRCDRECRQIMLRLETRLDADLEKTYEEQSRKGIHQLCVQINDYFQFFEGYFGSHQEEFARLSGEWAAPEMGRNVVPFGWIGTFMPWMLNPLKIEEVLGRVRSILSKSLKYYCSARKKQALEVCEAERIAVSREINRIGTSLFAEIKKCEAQMADTTAVASQNRRIQSLEKIYSENKKLQNQFWGELNAG